MAAAGIPVTTGSAWNAHIELATVHVTAAFFPASTTIHKHSHERVVFAVAVEGSFQDRVRGRDSQRGAGSLLIEPLGEPHENQFYHAGARVLILEPDPAREDFIEPCRRLFSEPRHLHD